MRALVAFALGAALTLPGCTGMSDTQQRTMTGAAGGAAGGAVVGAIAGNAGLGALIGAGVGAGGGYLWDQHKKSEQQAYQSDYSAARSSR